MVVLLIGYAAYLGYAKTKESRWLNQARGFLAHAEWADARLTLAEVLHLDSRNVEATRLMANLLAGNPAAELPWRKRVVDLNPGSLKDRVDLAMTAVKAGDLATATNCLAQVSAGNRKTAEYQNALGVVDIAQHEPIRAEAAFELAASLDPTNEVPRLNLAVLQLHSTNQVSVTSARAELNAVATGPDTALHAQALRELIGDAAVHRQLNTAYALTRQLVAETNAAFPDLVMQLDVVQAMKSPRLAGLVAAAQLEAGTDPGRIQILAEWEMKNESPAQPLGWFQRMPAAVQTNQPVALLAAECRLARNDWAGLDASLRTQYWGPLEFLRHALRARALFGEQMPQDKTTEWDNARQAAGVELRNLIMLVRLCTEWNWVVERTDLLADILKHHPEAKWAGPMLAHDLAAGGRTRALMTFFQQQYEQDPANLQAQNNLAMTAMLLHATEMSPFELARQVYQANPTNISYASTYAYALYQQKQAAEALRVYSAFAPKQLADPQVAGYYALVLKANGHAKLAREYFQLAAHAPQLLPEERALFGLAP